jgi:hypothetical protein
VGTYPDVALSALVDDDNRPRHPIPTARSETVADDDTTIFEFFDLQQASLDQSYYCVPQLQTQAGVLSATSSVTFYSPVPLSVTLSAPHGSGNAESTTVTTYLLRNQSAQHTVSDVSVN